MQNPFQGHAGKPSQKPQITGSLNIYARSLKSAVVSESMVEKHSTPENQRILKNHPVTVVSSRRVSPGDEAVEIKVDRPSESGLPEIFLYKNIDREEENIHPEDIEEGKKKRPDLPVFILQWQDSEVIFRARDAGFRKMDVEWNGFLRYEGRDFFELLLRLKEYGIEEIYRNGRLISTDRRA
jgi:hypothetical protein